LYAAPVGKEVPMLFRQLEYFVAVAWPGPFRRFFDARLLGITGRR